MVIIIIEHIPQELKSLILLHGQDHISSEMKCAEMEGLKSKTPKCMLYTFRGFFSARIVGFVVAGLPPNSIQFDFSTKYKKLILWIGEI